MKRPFAVIGFSMLATSLLVTNINFYITVALLIGATVVLCAFLIVKKLRKNLMVIFSALAVVLYIISLAFTQNIHINATKQFENKVEISGVVCETPQETDYSFIYVIKLHNENYKIRYIAEENKMFHEGDIVSGVVTKTDGDFNEDFFENSLSSKIYFTIFEGENAFLQKTGENEFYKVLGKVKNWFTSIVDMYLPGENGAMAKAMTIGDKSEITSKTIDNFNYAGTSHLLVISGLHLTLWSVGLVRLAEKFTFLRKRIAIVGVLCLLGYSALTGFSVSVIRAGTMVGVMLLGKIVGRGSDSINSIGVALVAILTMNPYATLSVSLWFTVLSTFGILIVSQNLIFKIKSTYKGRRIMENWLLSLLITTVIVSVSTTIFTLPVFIVNVGMLPVGSIIANIVMVDLALVLMILTMLGVFFHAIGLMLFANLSFIVTGAISNFLKNFAERIGSAQWSTISLSHEYFYYFFIVALVCISVAFVAKKYRRILVKTSAVVISIAFILLTTYCTAYDYNNPSVDVVFTDEAPILIVNLKGESVVINLPTSKNKNQIKKVLNSHNEKVVDNIIIAENGEHIPSHLTSLYSDFTVENTMFCNASYQLFESQSQNDVSKLTIGEDLQIDLKNHSKYISITCKNKQLIVIDCKNAQNLFEKVKDYDIIILYGDNALKIKESIEKQNPDTVILLSEEMQIHSVYFD